MLEKKTCGCSYDFLTTTMFFSYLLFLASVHSFTFVAATPEPLITPAPLIKRETIADGSSTDPILFTQSFDYTALPEKVNPWQSVRGPQSGYNRCNSSTEGPDSMCQTLVLFNIVRLPFYAVSDEFNNSARVERFLLMGLTCPE